MNTSSVDRLLLMQTFIARLHYFIEAMRRSMAEPLWPDMLATP